MAPRRKVSAATSNNGSENLNKIARNCNNKRNSNSNHNIDYTKLQISDVLCPLCRNILIEPITLPCQHCFCWRCLHGRIVQEDSRGTETCPQCQVRFGGWYRTAKKQQKLLTNEPLWNAIREMFLKNDNPLHPFLSNGQRKKPPAIKQQRTAAVSIKSSSSKIVNPATPPTLLLTVGSDSNDSTCAIRRDCNHFKPIDGHRVHVSQQQDGLEGGGQMVTILRVPATHPNTYADVVGPSGINRFSSDPQLSAFCLIRNVNRVRSVGDPPTITTGLSKTAMKMVVEPESGQIKLNSHNNLTIVLEEGSNTNATTVIMLQKQTDRFKTTQNNGIIKKLNAVAAESNKWNKNNTEMNNKQQRKYQRVRQKEKGGQPKRQSARIVAAATAITTIGTTNPTKATTTPSQRRCRQERQPPKERNAPHQIGSFTPTNGSSNQSEDQVKEQRVVVQLQADRELARRLHRLLNGRSATRRRHVNNVDDDLHLGDSPLRITVGNLRDNRRPHRSSKTSNALLRVK